MDNTDFIRNLKIIVIIALILAVIGAVLYILYGLALVWQAIAAGIITGLLALIVIIFIVISIYLWTRNYLLKRELDRYKNELQYCRAELVKYQEKNRKS